MNHPSLLRPCQRECSFFKLCSASLFMRFRKNKAAWGNAVFHAKAGDREEISDYGGCRLIPSLCTLSGSLDSAAVGCSGRVGSDVFWRSTIGERGIGDNTTWPTPLSSMP